MDADSELIRGSLAYLKDYRALLLESRGGAASDKEQYALRLADLIETLERRLDDGTGQSS
jgi:hypothetical protein